MSAKKVGREWVDLGPAIQHASKARGMMVALVADRSPADLAREKQRIARAKSKEGKP